MQRHAHCCPSVPPRVMSCSQALRKHQSRLIQVLDPAQELGSKKPSAESQEHHFSLVRSVRDPGGRVGTAQTEGTSQDPSDPSVQHTHRAKKAKHEQALDVLVKGEVATAFLFVWLYSSPALTVSLSFHRPKQVALFPQLLLCLREARFERVYPHVAGQFLCYLPLGRVLL